MKQRKKVTSDGLLTKEPPEWLSERIAKDQPVQFFWEFGDRAPLIEAIYAFDRYKDFTRLFNWFEEILSPEDLITLVKEALDAINNKDRQRLIDWLAPRLPPEDMKHIENFLIRNIRTDKEGRPPQPSYLMLPMEAAARLVRDRLADMIHCGEARNEKEAKRKAIDEIIPKFPHHVINRNTLVRYLAHNSGHSREDQSGPDRPIYPPTKKARRRKGSHRT